MKKLFFSFGFFCLAATATLMVVSCKKEQLAPQTPVQQDARYELKDGTLHFKDADAFQSKLAELKQLDIQKRSEFGKNFGFKSLLATYAAFLEKAGNMPETMSNEDYLAALQEYDDIVTFTSTGYLGLKIYNNHVMPVVNRYGIVFIAGNAYKFTDFGQIIVLSGDVKKFDNVTKLTPSTKDVIVSNFTKSTLNPCGTGKRRTTYNADKDRLSITEVKMITTKIFRSIDFSGNERYNVDNSSYTLGEARKKSVFGGDRAYRTPNTLIVNDYFTVRDCSKTDYYYYSNNYYAIDYSGASCNFADVYMSQTWSRSATFVSINSSHKMTRAGVDNIVSCQ